MNDKKLELNFWDTILHHRVTVLLVTLGIIMILASSYRPPQPTAATISPTGLIAIGLILFLLAIPTYLWFEKKLVFERIHTTLEISSVVDIINFTAKKNKWSVEKEFSRDNNRMEFIKPNFAGTPNFIVFDIADKFVFVNARGSYPTDKKILKIIRKAFEQPKDK